MIGMVVLVGIPGRLVRRGEREEEVAMGAGRAGAGDVFSR